MTIRVDWEFGSFLANCLNRIDGSLKKKFNKLLENKIIDKVIWSMIQDGFFPDWFQEKISLDSLSEELRGLRKIIDIAVAEFLFGKDDNQNYFFFDFSEDELKGMSQHISFTGVSDEQVQKIGQELNTRLWNFLNN